MSKSVSIRLDDALDARLAFLAEQTHRTKTFYVHEAVALYLEDLEDMYLANQVKQRIEEGKEPVCSLAEVMNRYGLES